MGQVTLKRYTNLASTVHILKTGNLTLLNPEKWEDRGDAHFMSEYKRKTGAKSVLALCFSLATETFHHWKIFAPGTDGVCLEFDKARLDQALINIPNVKSNIVQYLEIRKWREASPSIHDLPFLKRLPYEDEREYRIVFKSRESIVESYDIPNCSQFITRVTISPWLPKPLAKSTKTMLKEISQGEVGIHQSTLLGNEVWMKGATNL